MWMSDGDTLFLDTLNMSMLGVRGLIRGETPPANQYPVRLFVMEQEYGAHQRCY